MTDKNKDKKDVRGQQQTPAEGRTATTTTVEEQTTEAAPSAPGDLAVLTPEEEKILRMLHGKSLAGHEALEFAPGASMETRLKLALIEANLLEAFEAEALDADPTTGAPRSVIADELER